MNKRIKAILASAGLALGGCDGEAKEPTVAKVPYSVQQITASRWLVEVDYGGRRHVFLESANGGHGAAIAKIGDYPISEPAK